MEIIDWKIENGKIRKCSGCKNKLGLSAFIMVREGKYHKFCRSCCTKGIRCTKCKKIKSISKFYVKSSYCKKCDIARHKKRKHSEKYLIKERERVRRLHATFEGKTRLKIYNRRAYLKRRQLKFQRSLKEGKTT